MQLVICPPFRPVWNLQLSTALTQLNPDEEHFMGYNNLPLALHPSAQALEPSPKTYCSKKQPNASADPIVSVFRIFLSSLRKKQRWTDIEIIFSLSFPSSVQQFKTVAGQTPLPDAPLSPPSGESCCCTAKNSTSGNKTLRSKRWASHCCVGNLRVGESELQRRKEGNAGGRN